MDPVYTSSPEPYPGLRSFRKNESDIFFGRDDQIDEMIVKLAAHHFLCITGPSGCGKSSLARTGLMNHLEGGFLAGRGSDWIFCDLNPGDHPIDNLFRKLADAIVAEVKAEGAESEGERCAQLRQLLYYNTTTQRRTSDLNTVLASIAGVSGRPILILVDQFEELFRYTQSDSDATVNFVEMLLSTAAAARDIYVAITIRTDELEKCSRYPGLTRLINESQFLTPALDRYQIQTAIEGPAALFGGKITPEFSTWLLNSLEEEFDRLPLMQHALKLLYRAKRAAESGQAPVIGVDDFVKVFALPPDLDLASPEGRLALRNSLSDQLTRRYNALPDRLKPGAQRAFCALTAVESQHRDIRRPRKIGALAAIIGESVDDTRTIVRAFSTGDEAYLRCAPELAEDDTVDVTHECILRLWSLLQTQWLLDEKVSAENVRLLAGLARDWEGSTERASGLRRFFAPAVLRGYTRDRYQKWFDETRPNASWAARYLGDVDWPAPGKGPRRTLSSEEIFDRIKALLAASTWHRGVTRIGSAAIGIVVVGLLAYIYAQDVNFKAKQANFKAQQARAESDRIITSGLPPEQTRVSNLKAAVQALNVGLSGYGAVWAGLQRVYELYGFYAGPDLKGQIHAADFAADSKSILAVDLGGTLHQVSLAPGHQVLREILLGPRDKNGVPAQGRSLKVSPRGDVAAVGFSDGSVMLVDLTSATPRTEALLINGAKPHVISGPGRYASVFNLVFSSDASLLVTTARTGNVAIWERSPPADGKPASGDPLRWTLRGNVDLNDSQAADIWSVDIDRARQTIALGLADGRVCLLWLDRLDRHQCSAKGHAKDKAVKAVKFIPGSPILVSAGNDAKVVIWNVDATAPQLVPWPIPLYQDNDIWDVDFSRDGTLMATSSWDGSVRVYQTATWRLLNIFAADKVARIRSAGGTGGNSGDTSSSLRTVRFDPTGTMVVTASLDHTARVWTPLIDRTGVLDLSYRLAPIGTSPVRPIWSVALTGTGDRVAFTDGAGVYLRLAGRPPMMLNPAGEEGTVNPTDTRGQAQQLNFSQVLMPSDAEVVASAEEPKLTVWSNPSGGEWVPHGITLPGDAIRAKRKDETRAERGIATDPAGTTLAVEVREGETPGILLCRRGSPREAWACPSADDAAIIRPANIILREKGCAASESHITIAFGGNGKLLAAGAGSCPIAVYDLQNRDAPPRPYAGFGEDFNLTSLDFSPDGKALVATSSIDPQVRVWNLADGKSHNINYHFSPKNTAARYSPSGRWIVSASYDNTIVVQSAETGEKLVALSYRNTLLALAIAATPRGTLVVSGSEAGDVNVMRFFEDQKDITAYTASVLQDLTQ